MKFESITWVKGDAKLVQVAKVDENSNMIGVGKGLYLCKIPAKLILTYDGGKTKDIIWLVKRINGWKHLSQKRVKMIESRLQEKNTFEEEELADLLIF